MTAATLSYTGELTITSCWCGVWMALPADLYRHAQAMKGFVVWCPLGHEWIVAKNEADRQRERADELARQLEYSRTFARSQADQLEAERRSNAAYRGHLTRLRNRIANGVCPVAGCHRNFANVRGHIERMHPDWAHEHPDALGVAS